MQCESFDTLPLGAQLTVYLLNPVPGNTWQPPNGDFWGAAFVWANNHSTNSGFARIDNRRRAGGSVQDVMINNINLCFAVNFGQVLSRIKFSFGEYGGNLNLVINRQFVNFKNFRDIHGQTIGGVRVNVLGGGFGNDTGAVELSGKITDQRWYGHMAIGGQELWIDDLCWE
ncbi:MAG TPA: hypothetical protein VGQ18_02560 [Gemmatimonadales bacterium]|jgi:hypothetical protein|nr:hypothetical protein [Gemmatimonadales bacterium]